MIQRFTHSMVGGPALIWVSVAIVLSALPNLKQIAPLALVFMLFTLVARNVVHGRRLRFPSTILRTSILLIGLGGVYLSTGSLVGAKSGLSALLVLICMKALETNTPRDFQVLCLLSWFLALTGLFFEQELVRSLYIGLICWMVGAALIHFHRDVKQPMRRSFRTGFTLFLHALPVMALLFVFFPRSYGGFRFNFGQSPRGTTGMSNNLEPGSFSALTKNFDDVFRVNFPDGNVPPLAKMYWRGNVLWEGDGFRWSRGPGMYSEPPRHRLLEGVAVRQEITMEPHGDYWLFGMDRIQNFRAEAGFDPGGCMRSSRPVHSTLRYEVTSLPIEKQAYLLTDHKTAALRQPREVSARVKELVVSWRAGGKTDREVSDTALRWLKQEKFRYSLEPGRYEIGSEGFDDFLFNRRVGFCEHYAAAYATLMRVAGIPSRVVIGYLGGEFNPHGRYVIVRQSDAHAWCEIYIDKQGWARVDPTDILAPERVTLGLASYLQQQVSGLSEGDNPANRQFGMKDWFRDLRLVWDNANFQWNLRVLGFDEGAQRQFFANLHLPYGRWHLYAAWGLVGLAPILAALGFWLRRAQRGRPDALVEAYVAFCQTLAAAGMAREANEGPLHFAGRATKSFPENASEIEQITDLYVRSRYARTPLPARDFIQRVRAWRSKTRLKKLVT